MDWAICIIKILYLIMYKNILVFNLNLRTNGKATPGADFYDIPASHQP